MSPQIRIPRAAISALAIALTLSLVACGATRGRRNVEQSGFLRDYSQLKPREGFEAQEVYINPSANWPQYDSIQIDSVTLWADEETEQLKPEERQMLTDTLYRALDDKLGEAFIIVDQPAPGTLRLRAALTQAKGSNVPLRTMTTIVPQLRLLSTVVGLSADVAKTVGTATVEAEILDSITGERLAAGVDSRAGNKALFTKRTFQKWGDVEAACQFWAERLAQTLTKLGVRRKS